MSMYAKLFSRITESSLMEEPIEVRYTFVLMLAICDMTGHVIGTDVAIARRLNMSVPDFQRCVAELMKPDPDSNSKEEDGRRVLVSDRERGYKLVNYLTYREMKDEEHRRNYMANYMKKYREKKASLTPGKKRKQRLAHAEVEVEPKTKEVIASPDGERGAHSEFVELWTSEYPKHHGGEAYVFQGAKDGSAVKQLTSTSGKTPTQLLAMAVAAWKNPAGFNSKMAASLSGFNSKFNDIRSELNTLRNGTTIKTPTQRNGGHNVGLDYSNRPKRTAPGGTEGSAAENGSDVPAV